MHLAMILTQCGTTYFTVISLDGNLVSFSHRESLPERLPSGSFTGIRKTSSRQASRRTLKNQTMPKMGSHPQAGPADVFAGREYRVRYATVGDYRFIPY